MDLVLAALFDGPFAFFCPRSWKIPPKRVDAKVFRASVPVCSGGMLSVCTDHATGTVYCGGGNGIIRKVWCFVFCLVFEAVCASQDRPWSSIAGKTQGLSA